MSESTKSGCPLVSWAALGTVTFLSKNVTQSANATTRPNGDPSYRNGSLLLARCR